MNTPRPAETVAAVTLLSALGLWGLSGRSTADQTLSPATIDTIERVRAQVDTATQNDSPAPEDEYAAVLPLLEDGTLPARFNAMNVVASCIAQNPDYFCTDYFWGASECYQKDPRDGAYPLVISQMTARNGHTVGIALKVGASSTVYDLRDQNTAGIKDIATTACLDGMDFLERSYAPEEICPGQPLQACLGLQKRGTTAPLVLEAAEDLEVVLGDDFPVDRTDLNVFTITLDDDTTTKVHFEPHRQKDDTITIDYWTITAGENFGRQDFFTDEEALLDYLYAPVE